MRIDVLDHGYVELIEPYGHGKSGAGFRDHQDPTVDENDYEVGIIEAARQSTQGSFRGWEPAPCDCIYRDRVYLDKHPDACASMKNPGDKKLLKFLYEKGHSTPFEFAGMILEIFAPIAIYREWQRHRTQGYSESSARYAPLEAIDYMPNESILVARAAEAAVTSNRQASGSGYVPSPGEVGDWLQSQRILYAEFERHYQRGLAIGIPKEVARMGMPVGRYSKMRAVANLRNWLGFLTLRLDPAAQWEIRQYAQAVATIVEATFPRTYSLFVAKAAKSG